MRILAIDTAAELCAACVWDADVQAVLGRAVEPMRTGHAERLMAVIGQALDQSGLGFAGLDRVAVSVGPGSFTGIRVGVAAARGFSLALKVPAVGISTLEAVAQEARAAQPGRTILVLLGTAAGPLAAAAYGPEGSLLHPPAMHDLAAAARLAASLPAPVLAGSGAARVAGELPPGTFGLADGRGTADIAVFARLAAARAPGEKPVPLYLRAPDAKPQDRAGLPRRP